MNKVHDRTVSGLDWAAAPLGLLVVAWVYSDGWAHPERRRARHVLLTVARRALRELHRFEAAAGRRDAPRAPPQRAVAGPRCRRDTALGCSALRCSLTGGVLDMLWHLTFGLESGLDALVSPTHLLLVDGALLASPLRSVSQRRALRAVLPWPGVLSATAVTATAPSDIIHPLSAALCALVLVASMRTASVVTPHPLPSGHQPFLVDGVAGWPIWRSMRGARSREWPPPRPWGSTIQVPPRKFLELRRRMRWLTSSLMPFVDW